MEVIEDQSFTRITIAELRKLGNTFERCSFLDCDFAEANLSELTFIDCHFTNCLFVLCRITQTGLQKVNFTGCNLTGTEFNRAKDFLFEVHFDDCILDNTIFYKKKNKGGRFTNCSLKEADFTAADLTNAVFDNCNLHRSMFDNTQLKGADLSTSFNFEIDPEENNIKKAKFSVHGLPGLLTRYNIVVK